MFICMPSRSGRRRRCLIAFNNQMYHNFVLMSLVKWANGIYYFHKLILSFFLYFVIVLYNVHNSNSGKDGLIADMLHIKRCTLQFYGLLFPISNFNLFPIVLKWIQ